MEGWSQDTVDDEALDRHQADYGETRAERGRHRRLEQERQLDIEVRGSDQPHDARFPTSAERRDSHGVDDQQHRHHQHHDGDDQRDRLQPVQKSEEFVENLTLIVDLLDAWTAGKGRGDHVILRGIGELDAERLRQRLGCHVLDDC